MYSVAVPGVQHEESKRGGLGVYAKLLQMPDGGQVFFVGPDNHSIDCAIVRYLHEQGIIADPNTNLNDWYGYGDDIDGLYIWDSPDPAIVVSNTGLR